MRILSFATVPLILIAALSGARAQTPDDAQPALQAELQWVHLIDAGDYLAAWTSAAKLMQTALPQPEFTKAIGGARTPLGAPGIRALKGTQTMTQLPGAPDGQYVVAQFSTQFANKPTAIETIVALQAPDGSWHVAGYYIR